MVVGFPFEVPSEFSNLPQLKGRATIEMETDKGSLTLVVDGYSAPITAGNFVDLVHRGFYDGLEFIRSEQSYVLQAGDPPGPEVGFIDPDSGITLESSPPMSSLSLGDPTEHNDERYYKKVYSISSEEYDELFPKINNKPSLTQISIQRS